MSWVGRSELTFGQISPTHIHFLSSYSNSRRCYHRASGRASSCASRVSTEGAFFKSSWLRTYHNAPSRDTMKTYIAVDFAVTESATADYTAIIVFGLDPSSDIFVLQVWRRQADAATSVDALLDMVRDWKPLVVVTEFGAAEERA